LDFTKITRESTASILRAEEYANQAENCNTTFLPNLREVLEHKASRLEGSSLHRHGCGNIKRNYNTGFPKLQTTIQLVEKSLVF
jgi:hypothetical protein